MGLRSANSRLGFRQFGVLFKKTIAALSIILLSVGLFQFGPGAAIASEGSQNTQVTVSELQFTDAKGDPLTGQLTVGDQFSINGSWDASLASPEPGEYFVIGLPKEFTFVLDGPPIKLTGWDPVSGTTVDWALCEPSNETGDLTCTFTNAVENRDEISGTFNFSVNAAVETNESSVEFDLNGRPELVELPGGGGIDSGITLPGNVSKHGSMNANNWSMTWRIDIPGASLAASGNDTVHITDVLGEGHQLCDPVGLKAYTKRGDSVEYVSNLVEIKTGGAGDSQFELELHSPVDGFDSRVVYSIEYQTCTPNGVIPENPTTFTNHAQIEGWGSAGVGIDEVTSQPWQGEVEKHGSVLGGADRNKKILWTVTVPGNLIEGKTSFNLSEKLGEGHVLAGDTISGLQIVEQYGPNPGNQNSLRNNITDKLLINTVSSGVDNFEVNILIKDSVDFNFKPSDWRYIITYHTITASDDLPIGGTKFENTVNVEGKEAEGVAQVPGRTYSKSGNLNREQKILDGVDHSPFTTIDWQIIIPGEKIDGLSELTLTDVPNEAHGLCEAGEISEGIKSRLGLNVAVIDQINGGNANPNPSDLTNFSNAELGDDGEILITVGPWEGGKFSRDFQYLLNYTTCTTSGGVDQYGTTYTNSISGEGVDRKGEVVMQFSGSGTGTGVARGSVSVAKTLEGNGASFVPADTVFEVKVEEIPPTSTEPALTYNLTVPLNADPVSGLNQRGKGWKIRLSEPRFPDVSGVTFGEPRFSAGEGIVLSENGKVATATITPATNIAVELTNSALLGQLDVLKVLEGDAADQVAEDQLFHFTATVDVTDLEGVANQPDRTFSIAAGEKHTLENLPIGAVVTVTEAQPEDDDLFTWETPVVNNTPITITSESVDNPVEVVVTNRVTRTVGTFSLTKSVTGEQAENPAVPDSVTVQATWQEAGQPEPVTKTLEIPTDGTPVPLGEKLLIGTEVTLEELPLTDGSSIAWSSPAWQGTGVKQGENESAKVTIGRDAEAHVTIVNHAATSTAGINLLKIISGEATADVPKDTQFSVTASWTDDSGEDHSAALMINTTEPTPLGVDLPAGTVVTIVENNRPEIDTVDWGTISFEGTGVTDLGEGEAQVVVSDLQDDVTLVSLTNEANWSDGNFSVSKKVGGIKLDDTEIPEKFVVNATWFEIVDGQPVEQTETLELTVDGQAVSLTHSLPAFTEVTLSEILPENTARFSWATPTWVASDHLIVNADGTAQLTVQPAGDHQIELVNEAETKLASIELTKSLQGSGSDTVSKDTTFKVNVEWTDLLGEKQATEVEVKPDTPVEIKDLPVGTPITFTELKPESFENVKWKAAEWASSENALELVNGGVSATLTILEETHDSLSLSLTNEYDESKGLALGGTEMRTLLITALMLISAGLAAIVIARKRRA